MSGHGDYMKEPGPRAGVMEPRNGCHCAAFWPLMKAQCGTPHRGVFFWDPAQGSLEPRTGLLPEPRVGVFFRTPHRGHSNPAQKCARTPHRGVIRTLHRGHRNLERRRTKNPAQGCRWTPSRSQLSPAQGPENGQRSGPSCLQIQFPSLQPSSSSSSLPSSSSSSRSSSSFSEPGVRGR